ncbi:tax1-binding protein 1 homolog B isoform X5 [Latimeria chalumnae]|uniref:tax1-binding protein 1 homolog B isoform X5 n=1 Tax=Latimeria chalumnae TaxID=7897 RepID=UPI0003C173B6|nr:PREDICTED: tax1-binding protein 1 isoform X5 [Latimeria chalumnae]|eukprot:XP_005994363.1 PREDICTED: tax1-binding protein 1 isoform X5 [Latimeria chalumnae]
MSFQVVSSPNSTVQASSFAHVIFQNVAKMYLPNAPLECHYTLTPYIKPHSKDWVGIFKVGWSTARDYYTFLWSPVPDNYVEGTSVNRVLIFQGYYLPNDDGEFYQFCYVSHLGEIRGASTPFQFRAASPTDDLLMVQDECNSDILVVTTKVGFLEQKIQEALKEKEKLLKVTSVLEEESVQLREHVERLERELEHEKELYEQCQKKCKDLFHTTETLKAEKEEIKKNYEEVFSKIVQLEEDIMTVTQKGIAKETELDSLKDKLKKIMLEKEQLECQLKNEKDEKELYKVHLKNTEIENTKLVTEIQTLKNLDGSKENMISHYREEIGRLQLCVAEKDQVQRDILVHSANKANSTTVADRQQKLTNSATNTDIAPVAAVEFVQSIPSVKPATSGPGFEVSIQEQACGMSKEIAEKTDKYKKCKQMLVEEKEKCSAYVDEMDKLKLKWKEQLNINENLKTQLTALEDQYELTLAEKEQELSHLKANMEILSKEKETVDLMNKELEQKLESQMERHTEGCCSQNMQAQDTEQSCSNPYLQETGPCPVIAATPPVLQFGNPYAPQHTRDGADGAFYPDDIQRLPVGPPSWGPGGPVVCSQPARNLSRPDGLEDPEDEDENVPSARNPENFLVNEHTTSFCLDSSFDVHKKCPLCEVMFPPNYDQSKFEQHVESHWKVCPMCNEQFSPDCDQHIFESHVLRHFDGNVLNFD